MSFRRRPSQDGTCKYVFDLEEGLQMEAAFFHVPGRERPNIACVSTQLGCAVGCPFCATAHSPFYRNLTAGEIVSQVAAIVNDRPAGIFREGFEVSFMGMGEPLANLRGVLGAIGEIGRRYSAITRVSISTSGPSRRIEELTNAMPTVPPVHLQISLHATTDELRRRLVPNAPDTIEQLLASARRFHEKTGDQVFLNYVLLKGLNDLPEDVERLLEMTGDAWLLKVSSLNDVPGMQAGLAAASLQDIRQFSARLAARGVPHRLFTGDGLDVRASCGQLAARPVEVPLETLVMR